jgi:hypothetical protein
LLSSRRRVQNAAYAWPADWACGARAWILISWLYTAAWTVPVTLANVEVLRMDLGEPDGVNLAEEMARDRAGKR